VAFLPAPLPSRYRLPLHGLRRCPRQLAEHAWKVRLTLALCHGTELLVASSMQQFFRTHANVLCV